MSAVTAGEGAAGENSTRTRVRAFAIGADSSKRAFDAIPQMGDNAILSSGFDRIRDNGPRLVNDNLQRFAAIHSCRAAPVLTSLPGGQSRA